MSSFLICGLSSANKWSNRSGDILRKIPTEKKEKQNDYFLITFSLENGDMERLFGTKEMWISKKQKLEPCKFNKQLFLKNLFEFRSILREIFFDKILLEFDKSFNLINWCFQEQPPEVFYKKSCS